MTTSIQEYVSTLGIVDVHEHHLPEVTLSREVNLIKLFQQSYAGWTRARPNPLPSERRDKDPMLSDPGPTTWEALAPYLEESRTNSFVRNLVRGIGVLLEEKVAAGYFEIDDARRLAEKILSENARRFFKL